MNNNDVVSMLAYIGAVLSASMALGTFLTGEFKLCVFFIALLVWNLHNLRTLSTKSGKSQGEGHVNNRN